MAAVANFEILPDDAERTERTEAATGDILFFGSDKANTVAEAMGARLSWVRSLTLSVTSGNHCGLLTSQCSKKTMTAR